MKEVLFFFFLIILFLDLQHSFIECCIICKESIPTPGRQDPQWGLLVAHLCLAGPGVETGSKRSKNTCWVSYKRAGVTIQRRIRWERTRF